MTCASPFFTIVPSAESQTARMTPPHLLLPWYGAKALGVWWIHELRGLLPPDINDISRLIAAHQVFQRLGDPCLVRSLWRQWGPSTQGPLVLSIHELCRVTRIILSPLNTLLRQPMLNAQQWRQGVPSHVSANLFSRIFESYCTLGTWLWQERAAHSWKARRKAPLDPIVRDTLLPLLEQCFTSYHTHTHLTGHLVQQRKCLEHAINAPHL